MRFKEIHALFTGFTQNWSRRSGFDTLHHRLTPLMCIDPTRPTYIMPPLKWNFDVAGTAAWISRNLDITDPDAAVYTYSYSWAAPTTLKLHQALDDIGIEVKRAMFADPVKRRALQQRVHHYIPWYPAPEFVIPSNVGEAVYTRQSATWPSGSAMRAAVPHNKHTGYGTIVKEIPMDFPSINHIYMDDYPAFIEEALRPFSQLKDAS